MFLASEGLRTAAMAIGMLCLPLAVVVCVAVPDQLRDRRLRRRGVQADAVCVERIRTGSVVVTAIRCEFQPQTGGTVRVTVNSPVIPPAVGQVLRVVYDPQDPRTATTTLRLHSNESRKTYVQQAVLVVLVATAVVLALLS
ncbi:hypothetical protein [Streptomyces sp. ODS05-4]|uniref:hypothetical protein n=1 Tax=Streptomyces sp. ODS05-4 TaxID=2944939 RepID=UPI0021087C58|nr:hypothetical protein [Streptomyces sp. ODS05-4]